MNCDECGKDFHEIIGNLEVNDPFVGPIHIDGVIFYKCDGCNNIFYPIETSRLIDEKIDKRTQELLQLFPIRDFISAAETAAILRISRQALHKNRRINHGFIYKTKISDSNVFLKKSVLQFKSTGDGRFPLKTNINNLSFEYRKDQVNNLTIPAYGNFQKTEISRNVHFVEKSTGMRETVYAN